MNKNTSITLVIAILIILGVFAYANMQNDTSSLAKEDAMKKEMMMKEAMIKDTMATTTEVMMKDDKSTSTTMVKAGSYLAYTPEKVTQSTGNTVLFFKASWCPSCRTLDSNIQTNVSKIPENLTILTVDYDNSADLKKKYGVTTQHTLVQVDANGTILKKWSGGNTLESVITQVK